MSPFQRADSGSSLLYLVTTTTHPQSRGTLFCSFSSCHSLSIFLRALISARHLSTSIRASAERTRVDFFFFALLLHTGSASRLNLFDRCRTPWPHRLLWFPYRLWSSRVRSQLLRQHHHHHHVPRSQHHHPRPRPLLRLLLSQRLRICFRTDLISTNTSSIPLSGKPVYSTPSPVENTPQNNECRMVELRGAKVASFTVEGQELICLPQAFDLFLKHLVGGLHTVYTKLKRLEISPVVCNVEQVRILRGLGAIQPGVNRCKLISRKDFETLYNDCTNARLEHSFSASNQIINSQVR